MPTPLMAIRVPEHMHADIKQIVSDLKRSPALIPAVKQFIADAVKQCVAQPVNASEGDTLRELIASLDHRLTAMEARQAPVTQTAEQGAVDQAVIQNVEQETATQSVAQDVEQETDQAVLAGLLERRGKIRRATEHGRQVLAEMLADGSTKLAIAERFAQDRGNVDKFIRSNGPKTTSDQAQDDAPVSNEPVGA